VASRGIDVNNITHIINYDIPFRAEDYVHRIGRTGRMNRGGKAFTLLTREDGEMMTEIEMFINRELKALSFDTMDSLFWPKPPDVLPPEFTGADSESAVGTDDYLDEDGQPKQGAREGKRSRRGRRDRKDRGERGERSERKPRPDGAGLPDAPAAAPRADNAALLDKNTDEDAQPASWMDEVHTDRGDEDLPGDVNGNVIDAPNGNRRERSDRGERRDRGDRGARGRGRDRGRRQKDAFPVVCAQCNVSTTVPFQPDPTRPVYCGPCHKEVKAKRLAAEAAAAANGGVGESSAPVQSAPVL
jgi:CxxC-x17-CxxC domain-containing protein